MSSQVSSEREVELKYLSLGEKKGPPESPGPGGSRGLENAPLSGVPGLPFYRPREGQAYTRRRKRRKKKNREPVLGAVLSSPFSRGALVL
jgi:hypothetical protein